MILPEITLQQLQESAHTYRSDFVRLPVIGLERSTRFMTLSMGVRGKETVFNPDFNAELQHYAVAERQKVSGDFLPRTLETFFGACFFDFDPNAVIKSVLGHRAAQAGNDSKNTVSAKEVAASVIKNISKKINSCLFNAVLDETSKKTEGMFNGFDTITDKEIAAGNISVEKGNLLILDKPITSANAYDMFQKILSAMSDELREEKTNIFCSRSIADAYNQNYLMTHQGINYNKEYNQPYLEGSDQMSTFAPVVGKKGSKYIHITPKNNMRVGVDQMSDQERVEFNKYEPKLVTGELYMFIGAQFESIDPRRMLVVQLPAAKTDTPAKPGTGESGSGNAGTGREGAGD